jgi:putative peptidoglycan lipid II flippase
VSFLYFAGRLIDLPLGIVGTATGTVLIPRLSEATTTDASISALLLTLGIALPAAVGLALLANPIVALLFEHGAFTADNATATALALTALAASLPAFALARPLGAVFFAREQALQPLLATLAGLATTIAAGILARPHFGHAGVAAAISLGAWVTAIWLGTVIAARGELARGGRGLRDLAGIVLATAAMAAAVAAAQHVIPATGEGGFFPRAVEVGTLIALGVLVYAAVLRLLGVIKFRVIRKAFGEAG